jgi:hypothetical protein
MSTHLLDVNCLVAAAWPNHFHYFRTRRWLESEGLNSWATTPEVQAGFLRVSMNARVTGNEVSFAEAIAVLFGLLAAGNHQLVVNDVTPLKWPDWLRLRLQGHRQVADAALIACALTKELTLATLDEGLLDLVDAAHHHLIHPIPL